MKNDTAEAALGLLGLSSHVDLRTLPNSVVPLKRKASVVVFEEPVRERLPSPVVRAKEMEREREKEEKMRGKERENGKARERERSAEDVREKENRVRDHPPGRVGRGKGKDKAKTSTTANNAATTDDDDDLNSPIRCICEIDDDDGLSIACDQCGRWVHAACFGFDSKLTVPENFFCWVCDPRPVDKVKAIKKQRARQKIFALQAQAQAQAQAQTQNDPDGQQQQRKVSPGVERKPRRAIDGSGSSTKRKRRTSVSTQHLVHNAEDEQIDIDEPAAHDYTHIDADIVPQKQTRDMLRRVAHSWRGATALDGDEATSPVVLPPESIPGPSSQTAVKPLPPSTYGNPRLSPHTNPSVRPPAYAVHTTQPIPSDGYIAPFTSTVSPSSQYLSDPLNAYAHLSIPKPFVHLIGPPLDVALDARLTGRETRYVRNGCRPNAILRPLVCPSKSHTPTADQEETLSFAVFALRDLKANEEVVLGWEWDDGSVIHHLPALIDSPHLFAPFRLQQYRNQMTSMLHALSSTFTTCACGSKTRDCALARLAEFVDGTNTSHPHASTTPPSASDLSPPFGPLEKERDNARVDLGPLVGKERGFRTREKVPMSGGMSGVEMVRSGSEGDAGPSNVGHEGLASWKNLKDSKGKARATDEDMDVDLSGTAQASSASPRSERTTSNSPSTSTSNDSIHVPPRLRKGWIRERAQGLRRSASPAPMSVDSDAEETVKTMEKLKEQDTRPQEDKDTLAMPPPPLPPTVVNASPSASPISSPPTSSVPQPAPDHRPPDAPTSPTTSFANLSLLSPAVAGRRSSYFATALNPMPSPDPPAPPAPPAPTPQTEPESQPSIVPEAGLPAPPLPDPGTPPTDAMQVDEPAKEPSPVEESVLGEPFVRRSSPRPLSPPPTISISISPLSISNVQNIPVRDEEPDFSDEVLFPEDPYPTPSPPPPPKEPTPPPPPPPKKRTTLGSYLARKREAQALSPAVAAKPLAGDSADGKESVDAQEVKAVEETKQEAKEVKAEVKEAKDESDVKDVHEHDEVKVAEVQDTKDAEVLETKDAEVAETTDTGVTEVMDTEVPEAKDVEKSDTRDAEDSTSGQKHVNGAQEALQTSEPTVTAISPESPEPMLQEPSEESNKSSNKSIVSPSPSLSPNPSAPAKSVHNHHLSAKSHSPPPPIASSSSSSTPPETIKPSGRIEFRLRYPRSPAAPSLPSSTSSDITTSIAKVPFPFKPKPRPLEGPSEPTRKSSPPAHGPWRFRSTTEERTDRYSNRRYRSPPTESVEDPNKSARDSPFRFPSPAHDLPTQSTASTPSAHELTRQQSQEDGEIFSPPPPKAPPLAPRSFGSHSGTSTPVPRYLRGIPPSPASRSYHPPPSGNSRPTPNAPRALRAVSHSSHPPPPSSSYNSSPPNRPSLGPPPRGPSADRNRDWDRERGRDRVRSNTGGWMR
ncbi:hypothetical protein EIP91_006443 [Steccherinum ochraceum]|uniref:Zinc finger PHD-type domain-containing protein n=1 Tax=Steccherinum ochraceum TaxID=92696 RepID=A0A4R0RBH2_9APHY|nr:hypothetical protein EIP91_006443 [Steccherinum ochraceum]